jgi:hypothetical protein
MRTLEREHPVLVCCPQRDQLVPTGFVAQSLDDLEPRNLLIDCPACGQDHEWSALDAVLAPG